MSAGPSASSLIPYSSSGIDSFSNEDYALIALSNSSAVISLEGLVDLSIYVPELVTGLSINSSRSWYP